MINNLTYVYDPNSRQLQLSGCLTVNNLQQLWDTRELDWQQLSSIDVARLQHVDSAGLALLVYYCSQFQLALSACSEQLQTLINLYNLEQIVFKPN